MQLSYERKKGGGVLKILNPINAVSICFTHHCDIGLKLLRLKSVNVFTIGNLFSFCHLKYQLQKQGRGKGNGIGINPDIAQIL